MPQEKIVKARCSTQKGHFAIVFVQRLAPAWESTRTFRITPERAGRGYESSSLVGVYVGADYAGCPYCENKDFFLCNNCGTLNCQGSARRDGERIHVSCPNCQVGGYLEGVIEKLSGYGDV